MHRIEYRLWCMARSTSLPSKGWGAVEALRGTAIVTNAPPLSSPLQGKERLLYRAKFLCLMLVCVLTFSAHAADPKSKEEKLSETLAALAKTKAEEAALEKKHAAITAELETLTSRATALARTLQASERRVSGEEEALAAVSGKLTARQKEFEARKADYAATVVSLLRMRRVPVTAVFSAPPEEFEKLMLTASVLEKTNEAIAQKARALRSDMGELKSLRSETDQRRIRTSKEARALLAEQEELSKTLTARQKLQAQLAADLAKAEADVTKLSRESASLQELLGKLEAREKQQPASASKQKLVTASKHSMRMPVTGEILHRFGDSKSGGDSYRGVVLRARPGATVVAPSDGTIAFTGPFRDYGNMLLIKHPGGMISLIAGVGKINASLNQTVNKGEPVATMGAGRDSEAYVELRDRGAKPIDPADWFANVGG